MSSDAACATLIEGRTPEIFVAARERLFSRLAELSITMTTVPYPCADDLRLVGRHGPGLGERDARDRRAHRLRRVAGRLSTGDHHPAQRALRDAPGLRTEGRLRRDT
jgi:hypothetical protein